MRAVLLEANPDFCRGESFMAVAATLYAATLLSINRQRDRKGRAILCLRYSSEWELLGRFARDAIQRITSP